LLVKTTLQLRVKSRFCPEDQPVPRSTCLAISNRATSYIAHADRAFLFTLSSPINATLDFIYGGGLLSSKAVGAVYDNILTNPNPDIDNPSTASFSETAEGVPALASVPSISPTTEV
jgi:hypothetical protein